MYDTYFVEERSGVVGIGPLARHSPDMYPRRSKPNWRSASPWIHLIICILAVPLIIWNLNLLVKLITDYTQEPNQQQSDARSYHILGFLIVLCGILMYL